MFLQSLGKRMASFEMGLEIRRFDLCNSSVEKEFCYFMIEATEAQRTQHRDG